MAVLAPGVLHRAADRALTVGALLGLAALLSAALGAALGVRPLFFPSGSMAPTIDTGSLALARSVPASDLRAGDVVSVMTASGTRVTHRVVRVDATPGSDQASLTLRGDANRVEDQERYTVGSAYRVFWHAPWVGYAVGTALSPTGLFALALLLSALLLLVPRGLPRASGRGGRHAHRKSAGRRLRRAGVAAAASAAVLGGPAGPASAAPWTDAVTVSGSTFTAGTVPAPTLSCGALGALSVTFNWTSVTGATSYTLHYGSGGASTITTSSTTQTIVTAISGGTAWVVANHDYGSTVWSSVASNTRSYTVAVVSLCS
jgi:signal peptidase I